MAENPRTTPGIQTALSIAGSDSGGGAGIQADLKTFSALNTFGCTAVTAITAQNTRGVRRSLLLEPELIDAQIDAVASDIEINATKTGMLGSTAIIEAVARAVKRCNLYPLVVDPVMVSRSGDSLIDESAVRTLARRLFPLAAVVTPNPHEAARLLGREAPIDDLPGATSASREICKRFGARACIVTGIRRPNDEEGEAVDIFFDGEKSEEIVGAWRQTNNTHGAGCTFSAAITAALANGEPLDQAVRTAKALVSEAIRQNLNLGQGPGPVNHLAWIKVKK